MTQINLLVPTSVDVSIVASMLCSCFESNASSWLGRVDSPQDYKGTNKWWYMDEAYIASTQFHFIVDYDGPEDDEGTFRSSKMVTHSDIVKGLTLLAEKAPHRFAEIVVDNHDAETADCFLQCVILGDIIYG